MKKIGALIGLFFLILLAWVGVRFTLAQPPPITAASIATVNLPGTLTDAQGEPAVEATIKFKYNDKDYEATSKKGGKFDIANVDISPQFLVNLKGELTDSESQPLAKATVQFHLYNTSYKATTDEKGIFVIENIKLAKALKECFIPFILLIPGIVGLVTAAVKDWRDREKMIELQRPVSEITSQQENQFLMALWNAFVWTFTLLLLAYLGVRRLHFFSPQLGFEFYVPILGFIGALLYMFHMFHKGEEKVPKGKEFGMRILLAPYVAIIVVVLFGRDLGLVDLKSTAGRGTLAFFSGMLVVTALQQIIEKGQERLGRWREASRYQASEIAKAFNLSLEEDMKLREGDLAYLVQLEQYSEDQLREKARKIGFDEHLLVGLKKKCPQVSLKKQIGGLVWGKLEGIGVKDIQDFAQLSTETLDKLNEDKAKPQIDIPILESLRNRAREICLPSITPADSRTQTQDGPPPQEVAVQEGQAGPEKAD